MRKLLLSICILLTAVTFASAQGGAAKRKAEIATGLKEEVKLTDAQISTVLAIEAAFKPKMSAIKTDQALDEAGKKEKTKAVRLEKKKKMEADLGKEITKKVEDFYSKLKKNKADSEQKEK